MPPNAGHYFPCQRIHCRIKCELDHSVMEFLNLTVKMCVVLSHSGPRHEDSQNPTQSPWAHYNSTFRTFHRIYAMVLAVRHLFYE